MIDAHGWTDGQTDEQDPYCGLLGRPHNEHVCSSMMTDDRVCVDSCVLAAFVPMSNSIAPFNANFNRFVVTFIIVILNELLTASSASSIPVHPSPF